MSTKPASTTIPSLLRELATSHGDREAIVDGERRVTYDQLHRAVENCAHGLAALGVKRDDKVAILMGNRLEWIVAAFAATCVGGIAVAVNTWSTSREIAYAVNYAEASYLITTPTYMKYDYVQILDTLCAEGSLNRLKAIIGVGSELPASWHSWNTLCAPREAPYAVEGLALPEPGDTAFILFTSGSTSKPKGVELVHSSLIENTWNIGERQKVSESDKLWLAVSLFWGFGCSNALLNLLTHGGCIVLQESFDAAEALGMLERERCTLVYGTPNMIQALVDHPDRARRDLSALRSGATLGTPEQIRRGVTLGATGICHVYGLTEVYGNCNVTNSDDPLELRMQSPGKPLPGTLQRIVDVQTGREVAVGEIGEVRLKGHVMKGYYNDPEQTALAFDADGYFRTGDLGSVDAKGNLYFRGRIKEMVKTGGINVSPAEVESVLMTHSGVHLAVVTGLPHPTRDEVLAAVIIPKAGCVVTEVELKAFCRINLAAYKVPVAFNFCKEEDLPLTTTGKVQKNLLAASFFANSTAVI